MTRCLLIAGPTASGKTALALEAARRLDGEIVNADSMQIYAGLSLITARPSPEEVAQAPHHLFGTVDPSERFSVGMWSEAALGCIADIRSRGRVPILVGGTGLYFSALVRGLAFVPEIGATSRARAADLLEEGGLTALRAEADRLDPVAAARVADADRQRLLRIVEVGYETGRPLSEFQAETRPLLAETEWQGVVIEPDRDELYRRIELRFDRMMEAGALDEVRDFAARGLSPDLPAMKALGVPPLIAAIDGDMPLDAAVVQAKQDSRRYAKRQMTWFRNQTATWPRIRSCDPAAASVQLADILREGDWNGLD